MNVAKKSRVSTPAPKPRRPRLSPAGRGSKPATSDEDALLRLFARNVRQLRQSQEMSQEELADRADLDRTYISSIERMRRNVSIRNIQRLSAALGVDPRELLAPDLPDQASSRR